MARVSGIFTPANQEVTAAVPQENVVQTPDDSTSSIKDAVGNLFEMIYFLYIPFNIEPNM